MEKHDNNIDQLFQKYLKNRCTAEEILFLFQHFDIEENELHLKELIQVELDKATKTFLIEKEKAHLDDVFQKISDKINTVESSPAYSKWNFLPIIRIAASLILVSAGVFMAYTYFKGAGSNGDSNVGVVAAKRSELQPGTNKAVLTVDNGTQIALNDIKEGEVLRESGLTVSKTGEGSLVYEIDPSAALNSFEKSSNSIATPRGGEYQIILADGTKVWLNSASKLTFPTVFAGAERKVELVGEAYFEVAHDQAKSFIVKTARNEVEVLGTHFNVMEYPDEDVSQTSLLEGSVKIKYGNKERLLKPGQQAEIKQGSNLIGVRSANLETVMAWKNGIFLFDSSDLGQVMQQIARWYDAEIVYEGKKPMVALTGMVSRKNSLKDLLKILESAGDVSFNTQGNKIIVHNLKEVNMKK